MPRYAQEPPVELPTETGTMKLYLCEGDGRGGCEPIDADERCIHLKKLDDIEVDGLGVLYASIGDVGDVTIDFTPTDEFLAKLITHMIGNLKSQRHRLT